MKKIEFQNVTKTIKKNIVLNNLSFSWPMNQNYGIHGPNGSGKTMLLRAISGLLKVQGSIQVGEQKNIGADNFPKSLGLLIEKPSFIGEFTGSENLKLLSFMFDNVNDSYINDLLNRVGLNSNDKRIYSKYSLGMKQRLGIAQAIFGNPELVILDEPTNALDESAIDLLKKIILSMPQTTFIIASHDKMFLAEVTNIQYCMHSGLLNEDNL